MTPARRFHTAVLTGWLPLVIAALVYSRMKSLPAALAIPLAAAFLIEFPFYLLPAWPAQWLRSPWQLALSCLAPYLVYSIPTGEFRLTSLVLLIAVAATLSYWFRLLPRHTLTDLSFLALAAAVYLSKVFDAIYLSPIPKLQISVLGHIMLIRLCALAVLAIRGDPAVSFRFIPTAREIKTGLAWFAAIVPACALTLWAVKLNVTPHPARNPWLIAPEFFGILWIVALSEEFFFRGLLQQWLEERTSATFALIAASLVFGAAHLGFAHIFPNGRFALVAAVFGLFCGLAWRQTRSIQSSMVTHALAATLYRVFFQ